MPLVQTTISERIVPLSEKIRFARFLLTSGTSAVINVATRWLLSLVLVYEAAVSLAYVVGMVTAFLLARLFVFERAAGSTHEQFARFALVNAVGFTQVWLVSVGLVRLILPAIGFGWNAETIAHVVGLGSLTATSYFLHKWFSFRSTRVGFSPESGSPALLAQRAPTTSR